ncbi:MAG: hypothetical protein FWE53_01580 [Firmicutes bacterium]|nr:hypothetical protein [Bacillota bacterium]
MEKLVLSEQVERALDIEPRFAVQKEILDDDVAVIILKTHNPAFGISGKSYEIKLWGRTSYEWLALAFDMCPIEYIECGMESDILTVIKPHLTDKKYTAVFYADTPLITRKTFLSIMDYVKTKRLNVAKLPRGYVFVTDFVRGASNIYSNQSIYSDEAEFMPVLNLNSLAEASKVLHDRIIEFHRGSGVLIVDAASVFIDADVIIGRNTVINPNNIISGLSVIGDSVMLNSGNNIINSKLGSNAVVSYSVIEGSVILPAAVVLPFTHIIGGKKK